ncbi:ankyrin repeat domain-containing protein 13C-like isoform X2 [Symsagittifera roscoffensis]
MNNQCEPSEEEKNDYDSESSCGWSHLNIDGYDRSVEPDPSSFLVIESLDSAPSCGSINIDHTSILSLVDQTERWNESTWEEFCHTQTEAVKRYASASNLAVARNFDSLKALSIKHNSCDLSGVAGSSSKGRSSKIPHKQACQKLSVSTDSTESCNSMSMRSSKLSATSFSKKVRKFTGFKLSKQHVPKTKTQNEEIKLNPINQEEEMSTTHEEINREDDENEADTSKECNELNEEGDVESNTDPLGCSYISKTPRLQVTPCTDRPTTSCTENSYSTCFLELHRDVYENNLEHLDEFWRKNKKRLNSALELFDPNGLNALHLACRLGRTQYLDLFLVLANTKFFKSRTRDPNALGWTVLDEAVVLGNRKYIKLVYLMLQYHQQKRLKEREALIKKSLSQTIDFCITIKWLFKSWIPLLSRYLPSDTCVLYKKGNCIRLDSTLLNFSQNAWKRGKISVLYNPTKYGGENFVFIVPSQKQYSISSIDKPLKPNELSREVNSLLSNDVIVTKVSTRSMQYAPMKRLISRHRKIDKVGKYSATFYHWSGMNLKIFKRRDHLSSEQVSKNKNVLSDFYTGGVVPGMAGDSHARSRIPDLRPPDEPIGSFDAYLEHQVQVGRPMKIKNQTKSFKGCLAMSDQFPLSIEKLTEILEVFSNFRLFNKLKNFLQRGLPPGFPVYIEMPVFPTVQGQITMEDFALDLPPSAKEEFFYCVPEGFEKVDDLEVG